MIGRGNYFNRGNLTRLQHGRMIDQTLSILAALHPEWSEADLEAIRADLRASLPPFEAATIPGQLTNATAGRLAHRLDLSGASFVVDAASASSLVAVDLAARALVRAAGRPGTSPAASTSRPTSISRWSFASSTPCRARGPPGRSPPAPTGWFPAREWASLVLKRRADAERDGDRIYAVIQGIGLASDGKSQGLAAPSARGHARAMRRAYRRAGIDPATVMLVEGHGLGVPAADRAELRALNAVFPRLASRAPDPGGRLVDDRPRHAGRRHGRTDQDGAGALSPRLAADLARRDSRTPCSRAPRAPFALNPAARPWIHGDDDTPRRAGVNAFGFAGINAHAVLEEHARSADGDRPGALRRWDTEAILFSAPDRARLDRADSRAARAGSRAIGDTRSWTWLTRSTASASTRPAGARLGLVASSPAELAERLDALAGATGRPGVPIRPRRPGRLLLGRAAARGRPRGPGVSLPRGRVAISRACSPISASIFPKSAVSSTRPTGSPATSARPCPPASTCSARSRRVTKSSGRPRPRSTSS